MCEWAKQVWCRPNQVVKSLHTHVTVFQLHCLLKWFYKNKNKSRFLLLFICHHNFSCYFLFWCDDIKGFVFQNLKGEQKIVSNYIFVSVIFWNVHLLGVLSRVVSLHSTKWKKNILCEDWNLYVSIHGIETLTSQHIFYLLILQNDGSDINQF